MINTGRSQDHCTLWLEGTWSHCCKAHDLAYSIGVDRALADAALQQCVASTGNGAMSIVMFIGVTVFGWLFCRRKK